MPPHSLNTHLDWVSAIVARHLQMAKQQKPELLKKQQQKMEGAYERE